MHVNVVDGFEMQSTYAAGTSAATTATIGAETGAQHFVTGISGFVDKDCTITIKDGTTVMAEWKVDISAEGTTFFNFNYAVYIPITPGVAANGVISGSTGDCAITRRI